MADPPPPPTKSHNDDLVPEGEEPGTMALTRSAKRKRDEEEALVVRICARFPPVFFRVV